MQNSFVNIESLDENIIIIEDPHNHLVQESRTNLDETLSENPKELLVRLAYKFAKSLTKTNSKVQGQVEKIHR